MSPKPGADSLSFFQPDTPAGPDFVLEAMLMARGRRRIAGIDEAGRGPLAGPVVAAAVILDPQEIPAGINDSKAMTPRARTRLFSEITACAQVAWATSTVEEIDRHNILQATFMAMSRAVRMLGAPPDACLIDGRDVPLALKPFGQAVVRGDSLSLSIAAASIVAKVVRDAMMTEADGNWPGYGFASNAGYGAARHMEALAQLGPCPIHRRSFAPVAAALGRMAK